MKKTTIVSILAILLILPSAFAVTRFRESFNTTQYIAEKHPQSESPSPYWWVNSGGGMNISGGYGHTLQGEQPMGSFLQKKYASNDEADGGLHPQNIFRLVTQSKWQNYRQQAYFRINEYHESDDSHRTGGNGVLLFNRYYDQNNLYYAGLRVDGYAVIKKKINGNYYTLATTKVYPGSYNRNSNPNLLPEDTWIGVRADVKNNADSSVNIKLYIDREMDDKWNKLLEVNDQGIGGKPLTNGAYAGIRTDFMDASFENYSIATI